MLVRLGGGVNMVGIPTRLTEGAARKFVEFCLAH